MQAGRSFQTALEWNPLNGYAYYNLDAVYNLWQDYPSASRALSRAAALNPDDVTARFGLAQTLEAMGPGNETRALREWQAAGAAEYFVNQGQTFIRAGDITGAVEQYEQALAIDPTLPEGYYHLSKA